MPTLLYRLQQKSDQEKAVLALVTAVLVTALLFTMWGYNFAHSGKISNLASSAASVAGVVEEVQLTESFSSAYEQFKNLDLLTSQSSVEQQVAEDPVRGGAAVRHMNVFASPENAQKHGENPADVLY